MMREIFLIIVGLLFITGGIFALVKQSDNTLPIKESSAAESVVNRENVSLWPEWINIEKSNITANITEGGYDNGKWVLDGNYALYLPTSSKLGEGGNTVLYAHNRKELFGNLKETSIGDTINIGDSKGKIYTYRIYSKEYIKPTEIEKINTDKKDTVTLFTCDGWFDEKRLVVKAEIVS